MTERQHHWFIVGMTLVTVLCPLAFLLILIILRRMP